MRIETVQIENFRVFSNTLIPLNNYTCLVGPNGAGKSTIINALNVFFRERGASADSVDTLQEEDFHKRNTDSPARITVTFTDLSPEAQEDFKHYFRQGKLIVTAEARWDVSSARADVKQFGQRLAMAAFKPYFSLLEDGAKASDLKQKYEDIRQQYAALPKPTTKEQMTEALHAYEAAHPEACELIPSEDQFYGVSKGANRLEKYVQWVFVPAVKDASSEQTEARNTALGKLLARTVRARTNFADDVKRLRDDTLQKYEEILAKNQSALSDLSESLAQRLVEWAHPDVTLDLQWQKDSQKSVHIGEPFAGIVAGEGGFAGSLSKFGHGLQRSYLLTLLQELAGCSDTESPTLILACEEPELYQHPPQIRHLSSVFQRLSENGNQVVVCTHSPCFVSGEAFENVRMVRKKAGCATVAFNTFEDISNVISNAQEAVFTRTASGTLAKINQALQPATNDIFFAPIIVLVEGIEDTAYITTYLHLMNRWDEFRTHGCHIVPVGGKSHMVMPLAITRQLQIPTFVLFDSDSHVKDEKNGRRQQQERDNKTLLRLASAPPVPFPNETLWRDNLVMWSTEIGKCVGEEFDQEVLETVKHEVSLKFGNTGGFEKNVFFIANKLSVLWDRGHRSPLLIKLCDRILAFAETQHK